MLDHEAVVRLYGPWIRRTPSDAAELLRDYPGRWWIAGGWAIDAFVGTAREHGDLDIGIPREEIDGFVAFVAPRRDAWAAAGSLTPLALGAGVPDDCSNLWLRASGASSWEYDILLEHVRGETWSFKRDPRITRPLVDCLWGRDGIAYLRPEVQLLLKAKHARTKDALDLERCLPLLARSDRNWLARSLREAHPEHPWLERMGESS